MADIKGMTLTGVFWFIRDPAAPEREPAFHLDFSETIKLPDGRVIVVSQRQLNVAEALDAGWTPDGILESWGAEAAARVHRLEAEMLAIDDEHSAKLEALNTQLTDMAAAYKDVQRVQEATARERDAANDKAAAAEKAAADAAIERDAAIQTTVQITTKLNQIKKAAGG